MGTLSRYSTVQHEAQNLWWHCDYEYYWIIKTEGIFLLFLCSTMPTLTGILLDVSMSMKRSSGGPFKQQGGSWAPSIVRTTGNLIQHDTGSHDKVTLFVLGYGVNREPNVFDLLLTLKRLVPCQSVTDDMRSILTQCLLDVLEKNGAPYVREWAE